MSHAGRARRRAGFVRWAAVSLLAALFAPLSASQSWAQGFNMSVPTPIYFATLEDYYDGNYRDALAGFQSELRGSMKNGANRWIDAICYNTMAGECYYQMGQYSPALDHYTSALQLYVAFHDWMLRVQFDPAIRPGAPGSAKAVPWGVSKRNFRVGSFKDTTLISQGNVNNNAVIMRGGVVQMAVLFPVNVQEVVRCTALAMRRMRELMGPLGPHSMLSQELVSVLSRRPGQPNHWSEAWIDLQLGMAYALAGKDAQAKTVLERAVVAGGEYDHPLTSMAILELGRIALTSADFVSAGNLFEEASYAAVNFYDPGILEEAFRYGFMTHLLANRQNVYPPLVAAEEWARRNGAGNLQASLMVMIAEKECVMGRAAAAGKVLDSARAVIGRRDMIYSKLGARLNYLNALALYQMGNASAGDSMLAQAMAFQTFGAKFSPGAQPVGVPGSLWIFQILLTDRQLGNTTNPLSPRVAMEVYTQVLRDPTPADWLTDPVESLSKLMVPHYISYENWFNMAIARKEVERALEIADLARRHRFLSAVEFGGRLLNLRWVLEGPTDSLDKQTTLQRQDLLTHYPGYEQLAQQAHRLRDELRQMPLASDDPAVAKEQATKLTELGRLSAAQEVILREMALRREPCTLVFPPVVPTKEVQKSLPEGHALLAFFCTSTATHGFLMTNDKYGYWPIAAPKTVQRQVVSLLRQLGNFEQNKELRLADLQEVGWKKPAKEILDLLTKDSKANLPYNFKEIIIVPDHILWYVPFEALQVADGDKTANLISKVRLRYAPTVSLGVPDSRPRVPSGNMAVVLGKLYPQDDSEIASAAFEDLERSVPGAVAITGHLSVASGLYASLFDRLVVLSEITPAEATNPFGWSPVPLDHSSPGSTLASWFSLPWGGPDQVLLPGFHTPAESALKRPGSGSDLFLSVCGLMSTGARTVLISRWRPGGHSSYDLVREFAQELPHTTAADAWQRSVLLATETPLDPTQEPRLSKVGITVPPAAEHPFFWAGFLMADTGARPRSATDDAPPAAELIKLKPEIKAEPPKP
jgi:CHAT domain-containing protein